MPLIDQDYLRRAALAKINVGMLPAVPEDYDTKLDPDEEIAFQKWKAQFAPHDSGVDYDLRGAFRAGFTPDPDTGHWPDQFKKPNHETFSDQSQYAIGNDRAKAGHWIDNATFVPPGGVLTQRSLDDIARNGINVGLLPAVRAAGDITASPGANVEPSGDHLTEIPPPSLLDPASWRKGVGQAIAGDKRDPARAWLAEKLVGTAGLADPSLSAVDVTPVGMTFGVNEALGRGDLQGAAIGVLPVPGAQVEMNLGRKAMQVEPGLLDRVMQQQAGQMKGRTFPMMADQPWFDPLQEPLPGTIGRVQALQDDLALQQNRPAEIAKSLPDWQQQKLPEPSPRVLEEKFGVMQPLRGTPTEATTTGQMDATTLGNRIRELEGRRAEATNKFDRNYYDQKISELQDAITTPDWTQGDSGAERFVRTDNPDSAAFPFRRSRVTDEHPDEFGMEPPGIKPGRWTMTGGRKRWEWRSEDTPVDTPGSDTIRNEAGSEAVGHAGHWTAGDPRDWGERRFIWQQDTFNAPTPTPTPTPSERSVSKLARELATDSTPPPREPGTGTMIERMVRKVQESSMPQDVKDRLIGQAHEALMKRAGPATPLSLEPSLGVPDPRFHPGPGAQIFGERPRPSQFARMPEAAKAARGGTNPFDPMQSRFSGQMDMLPKPPPPNLPHPELPMFGLPKGLDPWTPSHRNLFRTEAPNVDWQGHIKKGWAKRIGKGDNVNETYKIYFEGNKDHPYFRKRTTWGGMDNRAEVAALDVGEMLGANVLPAKLIDEDTMVTPWVDGKQLGDDPELAREIIRSMQPDDLARQTLYEFLMADKDKHAGNYFLDPVNKKIIGIDYGGVLQGDAMRQLNIRNAFYRRVTEAIPGSTPISKDVLRDMVSKRDAVIDHFSNNTRMKRGRSQYLSDLERRFDKLDMLLRKPGETTYHDLAKIVGADHPD